MSDQPQPPVFSVMREFMFPEVLARMAKCSKPARTLVTPFLASAMADSAAMRDMVERFFPGIRNLPENKGAEFYYGLLVAYFPAFTPCNAPLKVEVVYRVGYILDKMIVKKGEMFASFAWEMSTLEGRQHLGQAVKEWRVSVWRSRHDFLKNARMKQLDTLESFLACRIFDVRDGVIVSCVDGAEELVSDVKKDVCHGDMLFLPDAHAEPCMVDAVYRVAMAMDMQTGFESFVIRNLRHVKPSHLAEAIQDWRVATLLDRHRFVREARLEKLDRIEGILEAGRAKKSDA